MPQPLTIALPPGLDLSAGYHIQVDALDPATGATVAGVNVSDITFEVDVLSGSTQEGIGPVLLLKAGG